MPMRPPLKHHVLDVLPRKHLIPHRYSLLTQRTYHHGRKWPSSSGKRGIVAGTAMPRPPSPETEISEPSYLKDVPLSSLLNSLLVLSLATLPPKLLGGIISFTRSHTHVLDRNKPLRWMFKKTLYDHFCIGEENAEITRNMARLRRLGMTGVVLGFAREGQEITAPPSKLTEDDAPLREWTEMNKETIYKLDAGDFIGIRCTGAGSATVDCMTRFSAICKNESEDAAWRKVGNELDLFHDSMHEVCELAAARGVRVLVDAESSFTQAAIDHTTLRLMAKFNSHGRACIFNTYQMYFKSTLQRITAHLNRAAQGNYTAGVKMVRGAFIHTEPERALMHSSKEATDDAYDTAVAHILSSQGNGPPQVHRELPALDAAPSSLESPWRAELVLATHNSESLRKALELCSKDHPKLMQPSSSLHPTSKTSGIQGIFFAQLMGMADEVSLKLAAQIRQLSSKDSITETPRIGVYKYTIWGSMSECLLYLLRRAEENRDAMKRSKETALAVWKELLRRSGIR